MTISRRHAKNKITMRDQFNLWPSRSYQIFIFNLRSTLSCKYEHEGEDKLKIRIDTRVSGGLISGQDVFDEISLSLYIPFYLREVRRARFSTCFVRSYGWWCSETWLRSALLRWFYQLRASFSSSPPRKYDNRGSRWTTLISPISNYPLLPCVLYPRWYLSPFSNICSE